MYLADIEIQRYEMEKVSLALLDMREERGLRQGDIEGLSERHVRRLEQEKKTRLTVDAAGKFASAFDLTLSDFLDELSQRVTAVQSEPFGQDVDAEEPAVV
jgi:transcriptional regulator with XRE-family HTH domain